MSRKSIATNIARKLWAQCGGFCQNPNCNKYLFATVGDNTVSLANVAHIIGHGKNGPRSEHELANFIDKDGITNLIMLCLECHKIVDQLETQFPVAQMQKWKVKHERKIAAIPNSNLRTALCERGGSNRVVQIVTRSSTVNSFESLLPMAR